MNARLVKNTLYTVVCLHAVIGYLLWHKLAGTDASKVLRLGELVFGTIGSGIGSAAALLCVAGFFDVKDQDNEALARTKLNSLVIFWSLLFFGGMLAASFLKAD